MIRIRNLLNGDIRTKWRRDFYDAGYGPFVPFGALGGDPSPVINWDFLQSQSLTSFSRTSNATLFVLDGGVGKLTYAANNLLLNSATLSTQTVTTGLQAGVSVILSFSGTGSVAISGGYTGSLAGTGVSDRVSLKFTTTTNSLTFTVTGSVTSAQLEAVTYQTTPSTYTATTSSQYYGPRYPYAYNGTTWDAQGLLVEAAATNLIGYSEAFDNAAWSNSGLDTVSANSTIAPSGTATADTIKTTATNTIHDIYNTTGISFTSGVSYTHSVYLKKNTNDFAQLSLGSAAFGSNAWANFDLVNGVLGSVGSAATASITSVGNEWYRCAITAAATSTASSFYVVDIANSTTMARQATWSAVGTESLYIWGAQLEAGDQATSYIPNLSTGTTTRNADTSLAFSAISLPTGLSFSRASNAMQYDAAGRLTYAPNNLLTQSNTFNDASWNNTYGTVAKNVADPFGVANNAWTITATASYQNVSKSGVVTSGLKYYLVSYYAKAGTNSFAYIQCGAPVGSLKVSYFSLSGSGSLGTQNQSVLTPTLNFSSGTITALGSGWFRISVLVTMNAASDDLYYAGVGFCDADGDRIATAGRTGYIYGGQVEAVTYETVARPYVDNSTANAVYGPRYDYDPLTRLPKGLLIEEGRTNIQVYSEQFDNAAWVTAGNASSITANQALAPSGVQTADLLAADGTANQHYIDQSVWPVVSGTQYTLTLYVKRNTANFVHFLVTSANIYAQWNLSTGAVVYSSSGSGTLSTPASGVNVGNGWWRFGITFTQSSGINQATRIYPLAASQNTAGPSETSTASVYIWGAQLEAGSFPTSYIPNPGIASGIRSADVATLTGAAITTLQGNSWTVLVEATTGHANATGAQYELFSADGGVSSHQFYSDGTVYIGQTSGTWASVSTGAALLANTTYRYGVAVGASSFSAARNGGSVGSTSTTTLITPTTAYLGQFTSVSYVIGGYIRQLAFYNVKFSDAKLQQKSVVGATL